MSSDSVCARKCAPYVQVLMQFMWRYKTNQWHSGASVVSPQQGHAGHAEALMRHRIAVYETRTNPEA